MGICNAALLHGYVTHLLGVFLLRTWQSLSLQCSLPSTTACTLPGDNSIHMSCPVSNNSTTTLLQHNQSVATKVSPQHGNIDRVTTTVLQQHCHHSSVTKTALQHYMYSIRGGPQGWSVAARQDMPCMHLAPHQLGTHVVIYLVPS